VWTAPIQVLRLWIMIRYWWEHAALSDLLIAFPYTWLLIPSRASLSGYRLIFPDVFFQVILSFLTCKLYLIFFVQMPFIYICYVLYPFELIVFLSTVALHGISPKVPIYNILLPKVHRFHPFPMTDRLYNIFLDVFTHVLHDSTLPLHGGCLLLFGLFS
jgi:hypothetical protein